jgi:hypothetical protein
MMKASLKLCCAAAMSAVACGGGDGAEPLDAGRSGDSGSGVNCATETRADIFAPGIKKTGASGYSVELVSAQPSPPARFTNAWRVWIRDPQEAPRALPPQVTPWMPDHSHGTPTKPIVTATATTGEYQIDELSLWMPGLWQVRMRLEDGASSDNVTFAFCIEE